jgi:hypothetical protein
VGLAPAAKGVMGKRSKMIIFANLRMMITFGLDEHLYCKSMTYKRHHTAGQDNHDHL